MYKRLSLRIIWNWMELILSMLVILFVDIWFGIF